MPNLLLGSSDTPVGAPELLFNGDVRAVGRRQTAGHTVLK